MDINTMKKIYFILFTLITLSGTAQVTCYATQPPFKTVNASSVSQQWTSCQTGSGVTIRTWAAVYPFINDQIIFNMYNSANELIGTEYYYGDMMVYDYTTLPALPPVSVTIQCNVVAGQTYRWELKQCCQTDGFNNLPIYVVVQETSNDQIMGNSSYQFISPQGTQQNGMSVAKDLRAAVLVHKFYNPCPGDCNGNGYIDIEDAMCIVDEYGNTCGTGSVICDMDGDCDVDDTDIHLFKLQFG